jgi:uncharacterized protein YjbI with pentapeptide repeats
MASKIPGVAQDAARGRLLTLGAGLLATLALVYTARSFRLSREGQVTDRYTKAIEQLGSEKLDVRIGGIYALERVARDSVKDHPTVIEVLAAFIREHSREAWQPSEPKSQDTERATRPDVQAAVTVIGRRNRRNDRQSPDLSKSDLGGADLYQAYLAEVNFASADLTLANLARANLTRAFLPRTILNKATLDHVSLKDTCLINADLTGASLYHADLHRALLKDAKLDDSILAAADLTNALLDGASLKGADLSRTKLDGVTLKGADLSRADLTGAYFSRAYRIYAGSGIDADRSIADVLLTAANLTGAIMAPNEVIPKGWKRDAVSGRLKRTDANSDDTTPI